MDSLLRYHPLWLIASLPIHSVFIAFASFLFVFIVFIFYQFDNKQIASTSSSCTQGIGNLVCYHAFYYLNGTTLADITNIIIYNTYRDVVTGLKNICHHMAKVHKPKGQSHNKGILTERPLTCQNTWIWMLHNLYIAITWSVGDFFPTSPQYNKNYCTCILHRLNLDCSLYS